MDTKYLITTISRPNLCPGCGHILLSGIADGVSYDVEAEPINHAGEIDAVLDGQRTYELIARGRLTGRNALRMQAHNADDVMVFVEHRCSRTIGPNRRANHPPDPFYVAMELVRDELGATSANPPF